uniref:PAS domain-containing protein n=1 Tax=Plectus sambesii TaxID=2011161 RepID=A0A914XK24_9BILA
MERDVVSKRVRSRHAAQHRRLNENSEFEQLSAVLPIARAISSQLLDKASVVRLTISCMRLYDFAVYGSPTWLVETNYDDAQQQLQHTDFAWKVGACILDALDGFLVCCALNGDVLYVSETISICLGLSQVDMIGNAIFDYIHKEDWSRWQQAFRSLLERTHSPHVDICIRMRSTLTKRASKDVVKSTMGYKVVQIHLSSRRNASGAMIGLSCLGSALPSSSASGIRLDLSSFSVTTHSDLSIHYVDPRGEEILNCADCVGLDAIKGTSLYQLVHAEDVSTLSQMHRDVLRMGATSIQYIRLLRRGGDTLWVEITAIRIHKQKAREKCEYITCKVTLVSTESNGVLDACQVNLSDENN